MDQAVLEVFVVLKAVRHHEDVVEEEAAAVEGNLHTYGWTR